MTPLKIAIIGNMNNNGFALLRYFRDLGADANLLLYRNDGADSLAHFVPQNDTLQYERWRRYIKQTDLVNGPHQTLPRFLQRIFSGIYSARSRLFSRSFQIPNLPLGSLKYLLSNYDAIVASGYAPAILGKEGIKVDLFFPYASGVEGIRRYYAPTKYKIFARALFEWGRLCQIKALRNVKCIINFDAGITHDVLNDLGIPYKHLAIPIVYVESDCVDYPIENSFDSLGLVGKELDTCEFSVLMHSRLAWSIDECRRSLVDSKNNHWAIYAFKKLIDSHPNVRMKLVIFEYGPDLHNTKGLVSEVGLDQYVIWVPKTSRRNIMWLLSKVSVGVGEFIESPRIMWGGTGWEVLASGKPLIQGFNFDEGEFEDTYGYPPPPMLPVRSQDDILQHLLEMVDRPEKREKIGRGAKEWFNRYNGITAAKQCLNLLQESLADEHCKKYPIT